MAETETTVDPRFLDEEQLDRLLPALVHEGGGSLEHLLYSMVALTGVHDVNLLELRWRDIDLENKRFEVKRRVDLPDRIAAGLRDLRRESPFNGDDDLIFSDPEGGIPLAPLDVRERFHAAARRAGLRSHLSKTRSRIEQLQRAKREGWLFDGSSSTEGETQEFLVALVRATKPDVVVETGTAVGSGTHAISQALEANGRGHLHTVDLDAGLVEQQSRRGMPRVTFHCDDSSRWCAKFGGEVDIGFVDSGPPSVRLADVRALWPKVRANGFLLVHDVLFMEGLFDAVSEICGPGMTVPTLNGLGLWQRR